VLYRRLELVVSTPLLQLIAELTRADRRAESARALAQALGAEDLIVFLADGDSVFPALGFPQTLPGPEAWQHFIGRCTGREPVQGTVYYPDERTTVNAAGFTDGEGAILVLLGGEPRMEIAAELALLLPLLSAAFGAERLAEMAGGPAAQAARSDAQARPLAKPLEVAREALRKALTEAEAANRGKDDFLAALSHELRTPLNPVLMAADVMQADPGLPDEARDHAEIVRRNAQMLSRLIDDLLDITRVSRGKLKIVPTVVNLHALLGQTEEVIRSDDRGKQVTLEYFKKASEFHVFGDPVRLQQVFWNVVRNAARFTPQGGTVRIYTDNPGPGRVIVQVVDSGVGMDAETLQRIFSAFEPGGWANQSRYSGLSVGLAISRAIVELHGGAIRAESMGKGHGATFTIEFPTVATPSRGGETRAPLRPGTTRKFRLLLVEDHDSTREVLGRILGRAGHKVYAVGTSHEALQIAASAGPFDAVISDLGLPDQSGFALMRTLKAKYGLPGVSISGYGMDEDVANAHAAGFSAHLVKPISFEELRATLDEVIEEKNA
jgi:signal transduction histidine kinase